ncbi:MAG TPA: flagellar motor switch protein FliN [Burkholderiaceae bacterium]|nr:flagellar motor switch protein FliN [Burkholderiaceae bacterium]
MNAIENTKVENLLEDISDELLEQDMPPEENGPLAQPARRNLPEMMRKIQVTLTLEVGSARMSLQDLMNIGADSVVELDRLAGEPLTIKVNGTPIGRAEVVVAGENYGIKVIDLEGLNLDLVAP